MHTPSGEYTAEFDDIFEMEEYINFKFEDEELDNSIEQSNTNKTKRMG